MHRLPKKRLLALLVSSLGANAALAANEPARLSVYLFREGIPVQNAQVMSGDIEIGETNEYGAFHALMEPGEHALQFSVGGTVLQTVDVMLSDGERIRYIVAQPDGESAPSLDMESSVQQTTEDSGSTGSDRGEQISGTVAYLEGTVSSLEGNTPVPGARVFISGIPGAVKTDADGQFRAEIPAGVYSISFIHPDFSTQVFKQITLEPNQTLTQSAALTPSGLDLGEHVVTAPRLEGGVLALMDERRNSSAVADVLSNEEISQAGDSNAADALKRVTGVTLVDGKYIYVRGLGERYSSNRLNNAGLPSPEPARRVVPMDLFPTNVIGSMTIQKTWSPNLPADFGGGAVLLRTKPVPEELSQQIKFSLGGNAQTTFQEGRTYEGGSFDWLGFDDGERDLPGVTRGVVTNPADYNTNPLLNIDGATERLEDAGEALKNNYDTQKYTMMPDVGFEYSVGDRGESYSSDWGWGYNFGFKFDNKTRFREEEQNTFNVSGDRLTSADEKSRQTTENEINIGAMANVVAEIGANNTLESTTLLSRSTVKSVVLDEGFRSENDLEFINTSLEWEERQLASQQFHGKHFLPSLNDASIEWQWTLAQAKRDKPDTRFYGYSREIGSDEPFEFSLGTDGNQRRWEYLTDLTDSKSIDFTYPFYDLIGASGQSQLGVMRETKDRQSDVYKYNFYSTEWFSEDISELRELASPEEILTEENISGANGEINLTSQTLATDNYEADQTVDAVYTKFDFDWNDRWQLMFGVRNEKSSQTVETYRPDAPDTKDRAELKKSFVLPASTLTFKQNEQDQWRFGFAESINRPDLKELSSARYIDADTRDSYIGNPLLEIAEITHYDVRWERYLTSFENLSVAFFHKEFTNPIEETSKPGAGNIHTYANADSAVNSGIEFQGRIWLRRILGQRFNSTYLEANAAIIDSEVDLSSTGTIGTNKTRPLQGQAPWVANLNFGYENLIKDEKINFLINMSGDTLDSVGTEGLPDAYEISAPTFDIVYSRLLWQGAEEKLNIKAKLNNLTDPTFKIVRGEGNDAPTERAYKKGVSFQVNLTYDWK